MSTPRQVAINLHVHFPFDWHQAVYAGTQRYAKEAGWHCVIDEDPCDVLPKRRTKSMAYDGIIARADERLIEHANRLGIPLVNTWRDSPGYLEEAGVYLDNPQVGRLCAEYLIERGYRRFGYISHLPGSGIIAQRDAFLGRLAEAGLSDCLCLKYEQEPLNFEQWWPYFKKELKAYVKQLRPPVGVYVLEPMEARLLVHACQAEGWKVPQDVAIIGGMENNYLTIMPAPSISCVSYDFDRVGYEAAELLDRMMNGEAEKEQVIVPPGGITLRDSTDFFAVDDELVADALRYISANLKQPLTVEQVAAQLHTSPSTLQRKFRQALSRSFAAEVRRLRIELAKRLLAESDRPIKAIALEAGFLDAKRLNEVFRRDVGKTPGEFRQS